MRFGGMAEVSPLRVYCSRCAVNFIELPDGAALSPNFRFLCKGCSGKRSLHDNVDYAKIGKTSQAGPMLQLICCTPSAFRVVCIEPRFQ